LSFPCGIVSNCIDKPSFSKEDKPKCSDEGGMGRENDEEVKKDKR